MNKESLFFSTNDQKIMAFFLDRPSGEFYDAQVSSMAGISRAGTNIALRNLHKKGFLQCEGRGRMKFYKLVKDNYLIRQFRVIHVLEVLQDLLEKIKRLSDKAVLFGSQAKGISNEESDFDMLIVTREKDEVKKIISGSKLAGRIRPIIKSPVEMATWSDKNKELAQSISEGILLWAETTD